MPLPSAHCSTATTPEWTPTPSERAELLPRALRAYGVPVIDYERPGSGLLLSVGSGLMMATMDALPRLRWCVDLGGGRPYPDLPEAMVWVNRLASVVVVHAWYSVTAPDPLIESLPRLRDTPVVLKSNVPLLVGGCSPRHHPDTCQVASFTELVSRATPLCQ